MGEPFVHKLRVRYSECDPQGVLFNANYLAYIDHTITELWRAAYGGYQTMLDRGCDIVVAEVRMRFLGPARFDDELALEAIVTHMGNTSLISRHRFHRCDDGELVLDAEIRHVFVDRSTAIKTPIPDWARAGLERWRFAGPDPDPEEGGSAGPDPDQEEGGLGALPGQIPTR
jgi:acyl-CoA thioester hydrolase